MRPYFSNYPDGEMRFTMWGTGGEGGGEEESIQNLCG